MRKRDELADPNSCLNKAKDDEWLFVLLGRDEDAPDVIREWVRRRIRRGKNKPGDELLADAERIARSMEDERNTGRSLAAVPPV